MFLHFPRKFRAGRLGLLSITFNFRNFRNVIFSANGISLRLGEVQMKICKGWLQALLSPAPRGFAARSRVLARLASLAQIGEPARRLFLSYFKTLSDGPPRVIEPARYPALQSSALPTELILPRSQARKCAL